MSWPVFVVASGYVVALLLVWLLVTGAIRVARELHERPEQDEEAKAQRSVANF